MAPSFVFAQAAESDFETLLALRIAALRDSLDRLGRFDPVRTRARFRATFDPTALRLVRVNGELAGSIALSRRADAFEIEHFFICPARQKNGLGSAVLAAILAETDAAGVKVRLGVLKKSDAVRFYERHGFRRTHSEEWDDYFERRPGGV
ncbi:MAG: GNAT family N-acetyltransferase [Telmatospirillum sp.]|nr:GNAT family N-acetyltransferase [Telmatospirillum sp.]